MQQPRGFTLVEVLMVIVILGIMSAVVGKIVFQSYQTFLTAQKINQADWQGFIAVERIVNDIHTIRSANDITTATASQLAFTDITGSSVQFQLSGSNLLRSGQTLASGIQALNFSYLDKNGTTTAVPSAVRYITVAVTSAQDNFNTVFTTMAATRGMQ